jgi:hypothetical protein
MVGKMCGSVTHIVSVQWGAFALKGLEWWMRPSVTC